MEQLLSVEKRHSVPGHSDWAKPKLELREAMEQLLIVEKRHSVPGHSDWAKPEPGLREGYGTIALC